MLSKRLEEIYKMIPEVSSVLDVGTDHCFLPIEIRKNNPDIKIGASDVAKGPLKFAKESLMKNGISDITLYLSDGLKNIDEQYECIIIAGMGAMNIINILEGNQTYTSNSECLLLQSNKDTDKLREWLSHNNFEITDESFVYEYKHYQIILARHGTSSYSDEDIMFGPYLRFEKSNVFLEFWESECKKLEMISKKLDSRNSNKANIDKKISMIRDLLRKQ